MEYSNRNLDTEGRKLSKSEMNFSESLLEDEINFYSGFTCWDFIMLDNMNRDKLLLFFTNNHTRNGTRVRVLHLFLV